MTPTAPRDESFDTKCVHAAHAPDAATGALAAPIQLATTFERDADGGYSRGFRYGREGTPNRTALEACVAELEGGVAAVAFSSGLAANLAVLEQLNSGDRIVASDLGYHGTHRQLREIVARRGVSVAFVDTTDLGAVAGAVDGRTRLLWLETPANPLLTISDLAALTTLAHAHGARVVCDSTFATPYCQRPFAFGVDVVIHSGTKYFGGHSDVLSGFAVIGRDRALSRYWSGSASPARCSRRSTAGCCAGASARLACACSGSVRPRSSSPASCPGIRRSSASSTRVCPGIPATTSPRFK